MSFGLWFGIVWCWRSISCFRLLASLPYMSIGSRVVIAVAFQKIEHSPYAEACAKCCYKYLQCRNCRCKKCHILCFQNRSFTFFCHSFVFCRNPDKKGAFHALRPFRCGPGISIPGSAEIHPFRLHAASYVPARIWSGARILYSIPASLF